MNARLRLYMLGLILLALSPASAQTTITTGGTLSRIDTNTVTNLTGYLKGNAATVSAQAVPIPLADGGTNAITANAAAVSLTVGWVLAGSNDVEATTTSVTCVNLQSVTIPSVPTSKSLWVIYNVRSTGTFNPGFGLTVNATNSFGCVSAALSAVTGIATFQIGPRLTNHLRAGMGRWNDNTNATEFLVFPSLDFPNVGTTTIVTRGQIAGATLAATNGLRVWNEP